MKQGWVTWLPGASWSRGTEGERRPLWSKMIINLSTQEVLINNTENISMKLKNISIPIGKDCTFHHRHISSNNTNDNKRWGILCSPNLVSQVVPCRAWGPGRGGTKSLLQVTISLKSWLLRAVSSPKSGPTSPQMQVPNLVFPIQTSLCHYYLPHFIAIFLNRATVRVVHLQKEWML